MRKSLETANRIRGIQTGNQDGLVRWFIDVSTLSSCGWFAVEMGGAAVGNRMSHWLIFLWFTHVDDYYIFIGRSTFSAVGFMPSLWSIGRNFWGIASFAVFPRGSIMLVSLLVWTNEEVKYWRRMKFAQLEWSMAANSLTNNFNLSYPLIKFREWNRTRCFFQPFEFIEDLSFIGSLVFIQFEKLFFLNKTHDWH